ncbi:hypothetical protein [Corynebacterium phocae]|nr:hypothetical protein [Corynebacterium phocae]
MALEAAAHFASAAAARFASATAAHSTARFAGLLDAPGAGERGYLIPFEY